MHNVAINLIVAELDVAEVKMPENKPSLIVVPKGPIHEP